MDNKEDSLSKLIEVLLKYRYEEVDLRILFSFFPNLPDLDLFLLTKPILELRLATLLYKEANPEEVLKLLGFKQNTIDKTLKLILHFHTPICLEEKSILNLLSSYSTKDLDLFFAVKRAIAITNGRIKEVYEIDEMEQKTQELICQQKHLRTEDLAITRKDLEYLNFKPNEIDKILKQILVLVKEKKLDNTRQSLLSFISRIRADT